MRSICIPAAADEAMHSIRTQAVTSRRFILLWLIGVMNFLPGLTVLNLYKRFGMSVGGSGSQLNHGWHAPYNSLSHILFS